jgi:hypothetical protein
VRISSVVRVANNFTSNDKRRYIILLLVVASPNRYQPTHRPGPLGQILQHITILVPTLIRVCLAEHSPPEDEDGIKRRQMRSSPKEREASPVVNRRVMGLRLDTGVTGGSRG